jgi:hypothetical protein
MLRFKSREDLFIWNTGDGHRKAIEWIATFNAISWHLAEREAVVTSWYRQDGTFHANGSAVDFRRMSEANLSDPAPYKAEQCRWIEAMALSHGLPIVVIGAGEAWEHWHVGPLHLLE